MPDIGSDLIGLLEKATADDLSAIDAACGELRKKLNALEAVRKIIMVSLNGKPDRRRPGRPALLKDAPEVVDSGSNPKSVVQLQRRRQIARLLAGSGPMKMMQIANRCEIPSGSITSVLSCDWFKAEGGNYRLTEVGRKEAISA